MLRVPGGMIITLPGSALPASPNTQNIQAAEPSEAGLMQMSGMFGWEAGGFMQMRGRCLHVDDLGPLPTLLGA